MSGHKSRIASMLAPLVLTCGCAGANASDAAGATGVSGVDADALLLALDDEYRAEAIYSAVIEAFGEVRPFINIIEAERRHAARAKAEMDRLGITYATANPYLGKITAPATLLAACEQGVTAEIENIGLYDQLLPTIEDDQVRATLSDLQWASRERHLPAFQRCVSRGGQMGQGRGGGHHGRD